MKTLGTNARPLLLFIMALLCAAAGAQAAERELHWDSLDVEARLGPDGVLDVTERHAMIFTGDWNGGERVFDVRPRQKLEFISLERIDESTGKAQPLRETAKPNAVDEYAWADRQTLRWRSRLPSAPAFANTRLTYLLHYKLSGVVFKEDSQYSLDHDFAFRNRPGAISRFSLKLDLDPAWKPRGEIQNTYTAGPLAPGKSFVVSVALDNSSALSPVAIDRSRRPAVRIVAAATVVILALIVAAFMVGERKLGRFAVVDPASIDDSWIEANIAAHPAELVGAAWDGRVGTPEVVALIARMTAEGKLESEVAGKDSIRLRLKVDRNSLGGYERALVDGLFFNNATETSTTEVKQHYKDKGFDPAALIRPELTKDVKRLLPRGETRLGYLPGIALFVAGLACFISAALSDSMFLPVAVAGIFVMAILSALLRIPGWVFRTRIDWGMREALLLMIPAFCVSLVAVAFLWFGAGGGDVEAPWTVVAAIAAWALCVSNSSIKGMRSRQSPAAIAFRKRLAAGRRFFIRELEKPRPSLRDSWYPWILAFGLGRQVDHWSSRNPSAEADSAASGSSTSHSPSSGTTTPTGWSGGGGLSGGAGATGMWAAAAAGMAAGVPAPGSGDSGGGGGSSGGGSSGGGGGGGW